MTQRGKMTARISCTKEVRNMLSNVATAGDVNYDELLRYLLANAGIKMTFTDLQARAKAIELYKELQEFKEGGQ